MLRAVTLPELQVNILALIHNSRARCISRVNFFSTNCRRASTIAEDQLYVIYVGRRCFVPIVNGDRIELFDQHGVMQIDAVASPQ